MVINYQQCVVIFILFVTFTYCQDSPQNPLKSEGKAESKDQVPQGSLDSSEKQHNDSLVPEVVRHTTNVIEMTLNSVVSLYYFSVTAIVPSGSVECYFYQTGGPFEIFYEVVGGAGHDIRVFVNDHFGTVVDDKPPARLGDIKVAVPREMLQSHYQICLDNRDGSWGQRHVYLSVGLDKVIRRSLLRAMQERGKHVNDVHKLEISIDQFYESVDNVDSAIQAMFRLQHRLRGMESIDRHIMEANVSRVNHWSVFQLAVMMLVSLFQVFTIRSLFDDRGRVAKVMRLVWALTDRWFPRLFAPSASPQRSAAGSSGYYPSVMTDQASLLRPTC